MKYKIILSLLFILHVHENAFSQMMLSAKIQGKESEKIMVDDKPVMISIEKKDYEGICNFDVILQDKNASSAYKRTIEITDANGARLRAFDESVDTPGIYKMDLAGICDAINSQPVIKMVLLENPANDLMSLPSKMKQLAEVHIK